MIWGQVLLLVSVALGLLLLLMPVHAALRHPGAFSWARAARFVVTGLLAAAVLTLVAALVFDVLSGLLPGLNPVAGPAYEPADAGLFSLLLGLATSLAVVCLVQFRLLRRMGG